MSLPEMPAQLVSREFLRVGGGFGAPAEGASPAGGLDIDNAGRLATDGDVHVGGALSCGGCDKTWQANLPPSMIWPDAVDGPTAPALTVFSNNRFEAPALDYAHDVVQRAFAMLMLPPDYDGSTLRFTVFWTCTQEAAAGDALWSIGGLFADHGDQLTGVVDSVPFHSVFATLGSVGTLHAATIDFTNTVAKPTCWLAIVRNGAHAGDTLAAPAQLLGLRVAYA